MKKRSEIAMEYFNKGYNCNQSVLMAFEDLLDIERDILLKMGSSFGGGMGRLREVCGAVSAIFMVSGILQGSSMPASDKEGQQAKAEQYKRIQKLAKKFSDEKDSIICRELLSQNNSVPVESGGMPEERTEKYYHSRPCAGFVALAAELMENEISQYSK